MTMDGKAVEAIGRILVDVSRPLKERFRALFTLRNLGGPLAVEWISRGFGDESALLKHELAYCLGQMQDQRAIPILIRVLQNRSQEPMVRHEAGEALGAIGNPEVLETLRYYSHDPVIEVAETCQLAVKRIEWLRDNKDQNESQYCSIDPAPPALEKDIKKLRETLLDESLPLFDRYRAMFALRNIGSQEAVLALGDGLQCGSALFRHEIGYVFGQMQHDASIPQLITALKKMDENPMVRHECAEALGSIAKEPCLEVLKEYLHDGERVVKESCEVALDMLEYENSPEFQYADTLIKLQKTELGNGTLP
ncbi:deoxyhypusine hydroxylase [Stegostoma tigrinum]|uniref:deoxyhypusine hydroxylase n=1 Tax=Stegostoma tigrinum TaxID=3053191 RepID=UPI00202B1E77|nr:deoxyhypusine hydroxylase [Stegostoma tigrinum]